MKLLHLAARLAKDSGLPRTYRLYCIVLRRDGAIVGSPNGTPQYPDVNSHAESRAMRKAGRGAIAFCARINRSGEWALAKPCRLCEPYLRNRGVAKIYYTISPGVYGSLVFQ
jgi:tRNA(Arg) A34 adenosine deaminase TadA